MFFGARMSYNTDVTSRLYNELAELEEKLSKSETERKILEVKFNSLIHDHHEEGRKRAEELKEKHNEFLLHCKDRNDRNEKILQSLDKIESSANTVFAKTERLKKLRTHYNAYVASMTPLWQEMLAEQSLERDHLQEFSARGRRPTSIPTNKTLLGSSYETFGGGITNPLNSYGDGSALISNVGGIKRIECGAVYIVPEKDINYRLPLAVDKTLLNLTEAGDRMLKELSKGVSNVEGITHSLHTNSDSVFEEPYRNVNRNPPQPHRYGMWPHIEKPPMVAQPLNYVNIPMGQSARVTPNSYKHDMREAGLRACTDYEGDDSVPGHHRKMKESNVQMSRNKSRDNFEIECLSVEGINDLDDLNLSDDEVLDGALIKASANAVEKEWTGSKDTPVNYNQLRDSQATKCSSKESSIKNTCTDQSRLQSSEKCDSDPKYLSGKSNWGNDAKKGVMNHKKSVEELKAMLSFEDSDECVALSDSQAVRYEYEEEDVPEEFIEQPWQEKQNDTRYARDVSRNVILEEDESDDNLDEKGGESKHEMRDWRQGVNLREKEKLVEQSNERQLGSNVDHMHHENSSKLAEKYYSNNHQQPRLLVNAVNLFKERRKNPDSDSVPAYQRPPTNNQRIDEQVFDEQRNGSNGPQAFSKQASAPIAQFFPATKNGGSQRNVGNYLMGLAQKEQGRILELQQDSNNREAMYENANRSQNNVEGSGNESSLKCTNDFAKGRNTAELIYSENDHDGREAVHEIVHHETFQPQYQQESAASEQSNAFSNNYQQPMEDYVPQNKMGYQDGQNYPEQSFDYQEHGQRIEEIHDQNSLLPNYGEAPLRDESPHNRNVINSQEEANRVEYYQNNRVDNSPYLRETGESTPHHEKYQNIDYDNQGEYRSDNGRPQHEANLPDYRHEGETHYNDSYQFLTHNSQGQEAGDGGNPQYDPNAQQIGSNGDQYENYQNMNQNSLSQERYVQDSERAQDDKYRGTGYNDREYETLQQQEPLYSNEMQERYDQDTGHINYTNVVPEGNMRESVGDGYQNTDPNCQRVEEYYHGETPGLEYTQEGNHQTSGMYQYQDEQIEFSSEPTELIPYDTENYQGFSGNELPTYEEEKGQTEQYGIQEKEHLQLSILPENVLREHAQEQHLMEESNPNIRDIKPSVMAQLIDSESESYQVSAEPAPDDSDFEFSLGK